MNQILLQSKAMKIESPRQQIPLHIHTNTTKEPSSCKAVADQTGDFQFFPNNSLLKIKLSKKSDENKIDVDDAHNDMI